MKNVLAGALVFLSVSLSAQESKPSTPPPAAMDPAAIEAMIKAGSPGEPHNGLREFAGSWNTKITMWMAPGTQPMTSTGTSENRLIMGGRYLEQRFSGSMMGEAFEGVGYTGYDNVKKQYWGTWMDSMSTAIMLSTGRRDGKVFTFDATMPDPMTGKDMAIEEKITITDANHHTMEMWGPGPDGRPFKMMEIAYTRK